MKEETLNQVEKHKLNQIIHSLNVEAAVPPEMKSELEEPEILCKCGLPCHPNIACSEMVSLYNHVDVTYTNLLRDILANGRWKNNRTGVKTFGIFGAQAKFDIDLDAFPILTTKKIYFKSIVHELLWFLKGDTNIKYLVDNDVHIWDDWAYARFKKSFESKNAKEYVEITLPPEDFINEDGSLITQDQFIDRIKTDKHFAKHWGELGEGTYGGMWRRFPVTHYYDQEQVKKHSKVGDTIHSLDGERYELFVDQLQKVIDKLRSNPDDRRIIVSAWHPYWVDHCALPPCHCLFQFHTEELTREERLEILRQDGNITRPMRDENVKNEWMTEIGIPKRRLNCQLYQRSCDAFLGVPFNITSYCLLTAMIAKVVGMKPGVFTHTYGDLHIYENHMDQVKEQLTREPKKLPKLLLHPDRHSLDDFKFEDIRLEGYEHHPAIKGDVAV